ncbi:hypothetical protein LXL04_015072 [Taraxacum kok-saghyz]
MGASSSTEQVSPERREAESLAASTGALTVLEKVFSNLSDPQTQTIPISSLQECFNLSIDYQNCQASFKPENFPGLLNNLNQSIVDQFFLAEKTGLNWIAFLNGYTKCCGRMATSNSLNNLLRVFSAAIVKSGATTGLKIESSDGEDDSKINGYLLPADLLMLFWMCWVMCWNSRNPKGKVKLDLLDVNNLVLSAVSSCAEGGSELNVWDDDLLKSDIQIPVGKLHVWMLKTVPNLPESLVHFVYSRLSNSSPKQDKLEPSSSSSSSTSNSHSIAESHNYLLTPGRAWTISLTIRSTMHDEILKACFSHDDEVKENILYRASLHGKGLNRFWSNVEGYNGPILVLISATSEDHSWTIGALTHQAYENKDTFYGTSGSLYAITPVFDHFTSSAGKEKNFVYSHLHVAGYEAKPKPVGIGFGGSMGNERVFMDEDFSKLIVRHHAYDKTYHPGFLFPNQGYLPTEAQVLDVEVWGLGGERVKEVQISFQKREQLFTEQRRKIDLKTFTNWEDSPEKMMMDMVANPAAVQREKR